MGDFRRQPSKVWWSTYEDEAMSRFSGFLGWGNSIDLSGNFGEGYTSQINLSKVDVLGDGLRDPTGTGTFVGDVSKVMATPGLAVVEDDDDDDDGETGTKVTGRKSLESDRGSSSSPSQGSHKSQDSGFSDSEMQNNGHSLSPQCSPELSGRTSCVKCVKSTEQQQQQQTATTAADASEKEKTYNETVVNYRKLKTCVKTTPPTTTATQFRLVEFNPDTYTEVGQPCLETAFDGSPTKRNDSKCDLDDVSGRSGSESNSPKEKLARYAVKSQVTRTKCDKISQIQNQLEQSFKLPKKLNVTQNLKVTNLFHGKTGADAKGCSRYGSTPGGKVPAPGTLDSEGFKVPQLPVPQPDRGSNHLYDLSDIEGPPISSSTPKSCRFQVRGESPVPGTARATVKKSTAKTTFATVRKLKGLSEKKQKGSKTLLESFSRCTESTGTFPPKSKVPAIVDYESSLKHWLWEMETMYEAEIMTTLQSKSLATDLTRQVTNMADTTSYTVKKLHQKTKAISLEFSKLCRQNKNKVDKNVGPLVQSLVGHITEFIKEYVQKSNLGTCKDQRVEPTQSQRKRTEKEEKQDADGDGKMSESHELITDFRQPEPETVDEGGEGTATRSKEQEVLDACECLKNLTASRSSDYDHERIEEEISRLGRRFREVVDGLLETHIQALVRVLEEPRTELALRTALSALTTLGLEGNQLGEAVSRCGGIRALLAVCLEARATAVRVSALRALATVCCVAETIRQFEQAGGVEIIADILADERRSEAELSEASAVIAQVTAPWVQDNHAVEGLSRFLNSLVTSLTRIVNRYKSCETLLLASAALANLTFMEPRTVWPLLENETAKTLLAAVRRQGSDVSVFIQEQAATVIANMSSVPECRKHLGEQRAVVALLCFLEIHHSPMQSAPEVAAAERVLQKSAIALSRLCSDVVVARQVIELRGVNRLVRLCKEEKERNHSDGVLVACLAALRKIVANCGTEALEDLNAMELVEPRLLDSFLLYSSKQESYV